MAAASTLARIERLIWILVYGGLLTAVLGMAIRHGNAGSGVGLMVGGGLLAFAGVILIFVRARMRTDS